MAELVLKGTDSLDQAWQKVETEKRRAEGDDARMDRLRTSAPDLADQVDEGRLPLNEATAAFSEREGRRRSTYQAGINAVERLTEFAGHVVAIIGGEEVRTEVEPPIRVKPEAVKQVADALSLLKKFCGRAE
jgi:hypothetical protein